MMGSNTSALNQVTSQMDMYFCSAVEDPTQLTAQACLVRTCQGQLLNISCLTPGMAFLQVAPAFGDAPGVTWHGARTPRMKRQPSEMRPAFHPPKQPVTTQAGMPEVTMAFCGPAQYKVSPDTGVSLTENWSEHNCA